MSDDSVMPTRDSMAETATFPPLGGAERNLDTVLSIPVDVQVVLGSATMPVGSLMKLNRGAVIPLDHRVGEPVDIIVNGRLVARGEMVVVEDDSSRFGVSLTEIVSTNQVLSGL